LGEFLRSRRDRLSPQEVGLPYPERRRRVGGLRREELASLARISVEYYSRLERGVHANASPSVLDAIARALRLSEAERSCLYQLAQAAVDTSSLSDQVRPSTAHLLQLLDPTPALLLGPGMDAIAANAAHRRLHGGFDSVQNRNVVHWFLSDPEARELYGAGWRKVAAELIGMLRLRTSQGAGEARSREVAADLLATHSFFRRVWQENVISEGVRHVTVLHPEAGPIDLAVESLQLRYAESQSLIVFIPEPGSPAEQAWRSVMTTPAPEGT
jgi:transcriptional regulator with XRE-family HTH domain